MNVAGKRATLGALDAALAECPAIADGVALRLRGAEGDAVGIVVVPLAEGAPSEAETRARVRRHLAAAIDPVFASRRIRFVERIERSDTGKVSAATRAALAREAGWAEEIPQP